MEAIKKIIIQNWYRMQQLFPEYTYLRFFEPQGLETSSSGC